MRSKAHISGHPIHPMLIPFPFAFLTGAFLFDAAGVWYAHPGWWMTGSYLIVVGVAAALLAAVPGFIDYFYAVPPASSGKRRATQHMIRNLIAVALFVVAWCLRSPTTDPPGYATLGLELVAIAAMGSAGWLGGTLVCRNGIGIDIRYAEAGKWQEETATPRDGSITVKGTSQLKTDQMKLVRIEGPTWLSRAQSRLAEAFGAAGHRIVLGRTEKSLVAFDDRCTHKGGSLAGGTMICGTVQCPWHGSQFDVQSGAVRCGPAKEAIEVFTVEQAGSGLRVRLKQKKK